MKKRIGVLMGGKSIEREVSFNSGRTVCDHLDISKYEIVLLFQDHAGALFILPWYFLHRGKISDFLPRLHAEVTPIAWDDLKNLIDFLYIAVHGRYAEDGTLQGMLEVLGIPYIGAKVFGSALGMNKQMQNEWLKAHDILVPKGFVLEPFAIKNIHLQELQTLLDTAHIAFPCIIKPVQEGSSLGVAVVHTLQDLLQALQKSMRCDERLEQAILVEEKVKGMEFTSIILERYNNGKREFWPLSVTEIVLESGSEFFDYEQKYMPGRAIKRTPAHCSTQNLQKIQDVCTRVMELLNFETMARIDGFLTPEGDVVIIDPNTLSGMGPASFLFNQAAVAGMNHTQLINYLIANELEHYGMSAVTNLTQSDNQKNNITAKTRIVVLFGGDSNEREISLESGRNVCYKLAADRYQVIPVFISTAMELFSIPSALVIKNSTFDIAECLTPEMKIQWSDLPKLCDFVFIALHGGKGENGAVQGALEMLELPYNGSGVLTSALCMDKFKTNSFLRAKGFEVPVSKLLTKEMWDAFELQKTEELFFTELEKELRYPFIVKPHDDGCSVMVCKVENKEQACDAFRKIFDSGKQAAMLEEYIRGMELTCGVIGNELITALPPSKAVTHKGILTLEEKFLPGAGENITPAPLENMHLKLVQTTMEAAYKVLGCKGYVRIDCFYQEAMLSPTGSARVVILEVNSLPALTPATCLFHQAAEIGLRPFQFLDAIIKLGFENHQKILQEETHSVKKSVVS